MKAFFGCITAPPTGGETPIGDVHRVYGRIDLAVREEFIRKQWMLVRNYNDGFALPWEEVFQTCERAEVEAYCRQNRIEFAWKDGDRLRTWQVRPAVRSHPEAASRCGSTTPRSSTSAAGRTTCARPYAGSSARTTCPAAPVSATDRRSTPPSSPTSTPPTTRSASPSPSP